MDSETVIGVVNIISKFKVISSTQPFHCIMIYQDQNTGFCFIKPLMNKIELEISMELFRIFTSYGPPKEVHVNSCSQEKVNTIKYNIKLLCPMFSIAFHKRNNDFNEVTKSIVIKLHEWMAATKKVEWEIGCSIVQREMNTEVALDNNLTPHQLFRSRLLKSRQRERFNSNESGSENSAQPNILNGDAIDLQEESLSTFTLETPNCFKDTNMVQIKEEKVEKHGKVSEYVIVHDDKVLIKNFNSDIIEDVRIKTEPA